MEGSGSLQQQWEALGRHSWQIILLVPFYHLLRNSAWLHRAPGQCLDRQEMGVGLAREHAAIYNVPLNVLKILFGESITQSWWFVLVDLPRVCSSDCDVLTVIFKWLHCILIEYIDLGESGCLWWESGALHSIVSSRQRTFRDFPVSLPKQLHCPGLF